MLESILSQLPAMNVTGRPDGYLFLIPDPVYFVVCLVPLFIIIHVSLMEILTLWTLRWPRTMLTFSILSVWTVSFVLITTARSLHTFGVYDPIQLDTFICIAIKWLMIYG